MREWAEGKTINGEIAYLRNYQVEIWWDKKTKGKIENPRDYWTLSSHQGRLYDESIKLGTKAFE